MSVPATSQFIVFKGDGKAAIETVPVPKLRDDYVVVKTAAWGINPTDWKSIERAGPAAVGARSGCDFSGIVVEVGSKVTRSFKPGDRIAGFCHGCNESQHEDGSFGHYIIAKAAIQAKLPDRYSFAEGATFGVGIGTVLQGLYQTLKLPLPNDAAAIAASKGTPILIYGGSTATGILGIQFAKLSGFRVIATSSPSNFDYLRSLGADDVFDYNSPTWPADVYALTEGKLLYAWDCIGEPESGKGCAEAMDRDREGGFYANIMWVDPKIIAAANPKLPPPVTTVAYTTAGEAFDKWGMHFDAVPGDHEFASMFWELAEKLLEEGKLKAARPIVNRGGKGGLEGVMVGMEELKAGRVSGGKLVYLADDAPAA